MAELSIFKSRQGDLSCTTSELFNFATDIRNLEQFFPGDISVNDMQIEKESLRFIIPSMGEVKLSLMEKEYDNRVVYNGTLFQSNNFTLIMEIQGNPDGRAQVQLNLQAALNPMLKMIAVKPIESFLERMIVEMEKFHSWKTGIS
jgi:hypothetical protein